MKYFLFDQFFFLEIPFQFDKNLNTQTKDFDGSVIKVQRKIETGIHYLPLPDERSTTFKSQTFLNVQYQIEEEFSRRNRRLSDQQLEDSLGRCSFDNLQRLKSKLSVCVNFFRIIVSRKTSAPF